MKRMMVSLLAWWFLWVAWGGVAGPGRTQGGCETVPRARPATIPGRDIFSCGDGQAWGATFNLFEMEQERLRREIEKQAREKQAMEDMRSVVVGESPGYEGGAAPGYIGYMQKDPAEKVIEIRLRVDAPLAYGSPSPYAHSCCPDRWWWYRYPDPKLYSRVMRTPPIIFPPTVRSPLRGASRLSPSYSSPSPVPHLRSR